jgi:PEP-CTERM motif
MRGLLKFAAVSMLAAVPSFAVSIGTGVTGVNWQLSQQSGPQNVASLSLGTISSAVVLTGGLPLLTVFPSGGWFVPTGGASWVGQAVTDGNYETTPGNCNSAAATTTCGAAAGATFAQYVYAYSLNSGATGGALNFYFTADNTVTTAQSGFNALEVRVNGSVVYSGSALNQSSVTTVSNLVVAANSVIQISAVVRNNTLSATATDRNPSGFLLSGSFDPGAVTGTPEPSTYAMLGLGGLAMIAARLRRK